MVMRVERIGERLCVVIPAEAAEEMNLREGAAVEISKVSDEEHRYVGVEEAMEAFRRIEPFHRNTFRELAKGPGDKTAFGE